MKVLGVDTETTGPDLHRGCQPFAVSARASTGESYYWDFKVDPFTRQVVYDPKTVSSIRKRLFRHRWDVFVFHNAKFDLRALSLIPGLHPNNLPWWEWGVRIDDTVIPSHLESSNTTHKLKDLTLIHFDMDDDDEAELHAAVKKARDIVRRKKLGWLIASEEVPSLVVVRGDHWGCDFFMPKMVAEHLEYPPEHPWHTLCETYARRDPTRTLLLWRRYQAYLKANPEQVCPYEEELVVLRSLYEMETWGTPFLPEVAESELLRYGEICDQAKDAMIEITGLPQFNPNSHIQVREYLYKTRQLPVLGWTKGGKAKIPQPATDAKTIESLTEALPEDHPDAEFLGRLVTYARYVRGRTTLGSYIDGQRDGLLYTSINQTGTDTTRCSSNGVNMHGVGKGKQWEEENTKVTDLVLRLCFGPPPGYWWLSFDYQQLQLRIFARQADEEALLQAFRDGWDAHDYMAYRLFRYPEPHEGWEATKIERRTAKAINFGFIFGAQEAKINLVSGREGMWDLVKSMFPTAFSHMEEIKSFVRETGYVVLTNGRRLQIKVNDRGYAAIHAGVNYMVQGDEGLIVKRAMVSCHEYITKLDVGPKARMFLQVHDELNFLIHKTLPLRTVAKVLKKRMEDAGKFYGYETPVDCSITDRSWGEMEDYDFSDN